MKDVIIKKNWTVLLVGGSSGIGKSELTKRLSSKFNTKIIETDDIAHIIYSTNNKKSYPAIEYWFGDYDWKEKSAEENVDILSQVCEEIEPRLRALINNHININKKVIIEGDFITPQFASSFNSEVASIFLYEPTIDNIISNYLEREGGAPQDFRASISFEYGLKIKEHCENLELKVVEPKPFNTLLDRVLNEIF